MLKSEHTHLFVCGLKVMESGVAEALADIERQHALDWSAFKPVMRSSGRFHVVT